MVQTLLKRISISYIHIYGYIWSHIQEMLGMMVRGTTLEVVLSVVKAMEGHSRVSAYVIQDALLSFYTEAKLYPSGVYREIPAVQDWALKYGVAIRKLVSPQIMVSCATILYMIYLSQTKPLRNNQNDNFVLDMSS